MSTRIVSKARPFYLQEQAVSPSSYADLARDIPLGPRVCRAPKIAPWHPALTVGSRTQRASGVYALQELLDVLTLKPRSTRCGMDWPSTARSKVGGLIGADELRLQFVARARFGLWKRPLAFEFLMHY